MAETEKTKRMQLTEQYTKIMQLKCSFAVECKKLED
jgi:hypothetical protein